ncbi:MAG TPA: DNA-3-methyladenine glycosylase 2 family protein [Mycobacteriales bacterium]|nr:DNA-3-methyladenine glycosylase 2 family protein [Mycobacteriales bacterium]
MPTELSERPTVATRLRVPGPLDLRRTLSSLHRAPGDPQQRYDGAAVWRASRTTEGPATVRLEPQGAEIAVAAWGAGAACAAEQVAELVGAAQDLADWQPAHPLLRELVRRLPGVRVPRTGLVIDQLVPAVLEQKVTGEEARRSWRELVMRYGEPAPGPGGLRLPPTAEQWAALQSWDWHLAGVEQRRALTIRSAVLRAGRLEECTGLAPVDARRRLETLPGIGPWTSAEVAQRALGDADAVSVGDYHLPALVGWLLAGRRTDDAGMLELLEPERPYRYRAVRLLELSGLRQPRFGPRMAPRQLRGI